MEHDECIRILQEYVTTQPFQKVDTVIWLQGDQYDRGKKVLELYQEQFVQTVLLVGNDILVGTGTRIGETNISLQEMNDWLVESGVKEQDVITLDSAMHTRDQAMHTLTLVKDKGWKRVAVSGSTHHQLRPFLTFLQAATELNWNGIIFNLTDDILPTDIPSGRNKTSKEVFQDEVEKISLYKEHVMSPCKALTLIQMYPYDYYIPSG